MALCTPAIPQVMVDTPYGDCFAVLTKWVFEPLPAAASSSAAATARASATATASAAAAGSSSATVAGGGCSVSVSAELVRPKHPCTVATPTVAIPTAAILTAAILARCGSRTRALWQHLLGLRLHTHHCCTG